ncbi:MAG TPA: glutaredoxin domain-containing protein [Polyangiaceae bacterium]|jgi:glutaredoxin
MRRAFQVLLLAAFALAWGACKRRPPDELTTASLEPAATSLPALSLTDDTPDLLLTWVDARGDAHVAKNPADVPMEGRDQVRVVVTTREDGLRDFFYVANLTVKSPDGTYPVSTMARVDWDAMISKRREALASPETPPAEEPAAPGASAAPATAFTVIIYGASWCGACHEALAYLKRRRVPVIEKDIEQDPGAESEMQVKLARAGIHGGSIPVIDVKGKILIGFEPHALEAAVRGASAVAL